MSLTVVARSVRRRDTSSPSMNCASSSASAGGRGSSAASASSAAANSRGDSPGSRTRMRSLEYATSAGTVGQNRALNAAANAVQSCRVARGTEPSQDAASPSSWRQTQVAVALLSHSPVSARIST